MIDFKTRWIALALALAAAAPGSARAQTASTEAAEARAAAEEARLQARLEAEEAYRQALEMAASERRDAEALLERAQVEVERQRAEETRRRQETERSLATRETERVQRERELAEMREELARAHDELRRASREVARVNRELSRGAAPRAFVVNVSERPVIGVALGAQARDGVEIVGVSPNGPAERAGIEQGDVIVSIGGQALAADASGEVSRDLIYEVMSEVEAGEEVPVTVRRGDETLEFLVTAEAREPFVWQSLQRLPSPPGAPGAPRAPNVLVERIEVPEIDTERLAEQIHEITENVNRRVFVLPDGSGDYSVDIQSFSRFGDDALAEADLWFGLTVARGLELAPVDEGLGAYFDTDRGVLVLSAREGNTLELESGDVILNVGDSEIARPSDFMRALRRIEPGKAFTIDIKRKQRDRTLELVMPENRVGFRFEADGWDFDFAPAAPKD